MMIGTAENRAFYDIALRYKNAEGNWVEVDEANFPTGGVEVVLPYPNGTDSKDTFTIVHMLTTVARAGELELVSHTKQADGLHFPCDQSVALRRELGEVCCTFGRRLGWQRRLGRRHL